MFEREREAMAVGLFSPYCMLPVAHFSHVLIISALTRFLLSKKENLNETNLDEYKSNVKHSFLKS